MSLYNVMYAKVNVIHNLMTNLITVQVTRTLIVSCGCRHGVQMKKLVVEFVLYTQGCTVYCHLIAVLLNIQE